MAEYSPYPADDPRHSTARVRGKFNDLIVLMRQDLETVGDPQARALLEAAAEVLGGLSKAFSDYEQRGEADLHEHEGLAS
jgi:hypothetical protein